MQRHHRVGRILSSYVAMNMHWEPQKLAFPKLPKGMEWNLVLATEKAEIL